MITYNPNDWYWIVAGSVTQVYSSKVGDYVQVNDPAYSAWKLSGGAAPAIDSEDTLSEILANASVRPINSALLDGFKGKQASRFTLEIAAKVAFNHENRLRSLEGKQPVTAGQFATALKAML